jgi:nicotinamide-nucleotide amidase
MSEETGTTTGLAARIGEALCERDETLAVAEGHTAGRVAARLTGEPGASAFLDRGYCTYSYDSLRDVLAVSREALDAHGVVSEPVTRAMARSARDLADATWGVATTGVAGPEGGDAERPVGTTLVAVAYAAPWETGASFARVERYVLDGDRAAVLAGGTERALADLLAAVETTAVEGDAADGDGRDP